MREQPVEEIKVARLPGTGQPMLARWWSWPNVRAKVVLPPWFGPEITMMRSRSFRWKSLHTGAVFWREEGTGER